MKLHRTTLLFASAFLCIGLSACKDFPDLEVSEAEFDKKTPYPKLIPLEVLLKEPEATITDEIETELTTRRDDLNATPQAADAEDTNDPVLNRIDALRARQEEKAANDPIIDEKLRKRMEDGIKPPTLPE